MAVLAGIIAAVLVLQNVSRDAPQINEVQQSPETSAAETSSTTAKIATTAVTEPPQPQEFRTSDMDNPNKITVTTEKTSAVITRTFSIMYFTTTPQFTANGVIAA